MNSNKRNLEQELGQKLEYTTPIEHRSFLIERKKHWQTQTDQEKKYRSITLKIIMTLTAAFAFSSVSLAADPEQRIDTLENVSAIQQAYTKNLEETVKKLSKDIQGLTTAKTQLEEAILQLTSKIAQLENRHQSHADEVIPRLNQVVDDAKNHSSKISTLQTDTVNHSKQIADAEDTIKSHVKKINDLENLSPCKGHSFIFRNKQSGNYHRIVGSEGVGSAPFKHQGGHQDYWTWQIECI